MNKIVVYADENCQNFLLAEIEDNNLSYLKENLSQRMKIGNKIRYSFELIKGKNDLEHLVDKLESSIQLLNDTGIANCSLKRF